MLSNWHQNEHKYLRQKQSRMLAKQQSCYWNRPFTALLLNLCKCKTRRLQKCEHRNVKTESHVWPKNRGKNPVCSNTTHFSPVFQNLVSSISTYIQEYLKSPYLWCEREVLQPQTSHSCLPASPITVKLAKSTLNQIMLSNCFHISVSDNGCLLFSSWYSRHGIQR